MHTRMQLILLLVFYSRYTEIPTVATTTLRICFEIIGCVGAEL